MRGDRMKCSRIPKYPKALDSATSRRPPPAPGARAGRRPLNQNTRCPLSPYHCTHECACRRFHYSGSYPRAAAYGCIQPTFVQIGSVTGNEMEIANKTRRRTENRIDRVRNREPDLDRNRPRDEK
ncbi:hypothetical protein EVAR_40885_1 [Eumeta japonica]|uniref:Uncharacterized protein n=1 Tax=Eumeta variegata TaxID=151549 RepID=A0A4C1X4F9_EUMVA|nr:hypothetical protein EVAR_40885_1 [Eumeta japonica]